MRYPKTFELPTTDQLTGLVTAAYLRYLLREKLLPEAHTSGAPLCLFLLDTDSFLAINTEHGREFGDQVLIEIARAMQNAAPANAVVSRYGGDEFCVVLPEMRLDDAFTLAEELRRQIAAIRFKKYPSVRLTVSIGLAAFPAHAKNDVELMREADQALYLAKTTGRNKISIPLADSRMITKTSYYTAPQLERLSALAKKVKRNEATLLREALDDLLKKYDDQLNKPPKH